MFLEEAGGLDAHRCSAWGVAAARPLAEVVALPLREQLERPAKVAEPTCPRGAAVAAGVPREEPLPGVPLLVVVAEQPVERRRRGALEGAPGAFARLRRG